MVCKTINKDMYSRLKFLLPKIGTVAAPILMLTALLLLVWIMRTTYASLLNYDQSLSRLITGKTFIYSFQYPALPIRYWYSLITIFIAVALPYTALARFLTHRKTPLAYWSFIIPTLALYLYLLLILTIPFSWLIQYINSKGLTNKRLYGVFYGLAWYVVILVFLFWITRKPRRKKPQTKNDNQSKNKPISNNNSSI